MNQYVRRTLWKNRYAPSTQWVGIEHCFFRLDLYGVIDDAGRFVTEIPGIHRFRAPRISTRPRSKDFFTASPGRRRISRPCAIPAP